MTFSGRFEVTGVWGGLHRLRFTANASSGVNGKVSVVNLAARGARLTRCLLEGNSGGSGSVVFLSGSNCSDARIDHNEFRDCAAQVITHETDAPQDHLRIRIDHNYFNGHDIVFTSDGTPLESVITILTNAFQDWLGSIDTNLFVNCLRADLDPPARADVDQGRRDHHR